MEDEKLTKKEKQAILDETSPEAVAIDEAMRKAVAARSPKYPDDAKKMKSMKKPKPMNKGGSVRAYKKGGKVRGCGIATQGVRKAKGSY